MILVDSSVWIDHLRQSDAELQKLLAKDQVLCHPLVIGEVALGSIKEREIMLRGLHRLYKVSVARDSEVLHLIAHQQLFGAGIGYVDAHLLAAVRMTPEALLWTRDRRLYRAAEKLQIAFDAAS